MSNIPSTYSWLEKEPGPKMILEALKLIGTLETPGTADNPKIVAWADEVKAACPSPYNNWSADFYNDDSIPWCGLAMAIVTIRAGMENGVMRADRQPPNKYLSALAWAAYGETIPKDQAMLGDVLVFVRKGGGHVALYVGETSTHFHMLGGNQDDAFNIRTKAKSTLYAVRRPKYNSRPTNVRKILLKSTGTLSGSEQ